jgi:hypothetical protein
MTHRGGETVKAGFYWNLGRWEIVAVSGAREGTLPGDRATRYVTLPLPLMLLAAPLMGGLFVVFLPLIGFAMLALHAGRVGVRHAREAARRVSSTPGGGNPPVEAGSRSVPVPDVAAGRGVASPAAPHGHGTAALPRAS